MCVYVYGINLKYIFKNFTWKFADIFNFTSSNKWATEYFPCLFICITVYHFQALWTYSTEHHGLVVALQLHNLEVLCSNLSAPAQVFHGFTSTTQANACTMTVSFDICSNSLLTYHPIIQCCTVSVTESIIHQTKNKHINKWTYNIYIQTHTLLVM